MSSLPQGAGDLVDELTALLDEEIELLELRCSQLGTLTSATLERNDDVLETVLREIEKTQQRQVATDLKLQALRDAFAEALGWSVEEMRLSQLADSLPPAQGSAVRYRRRQIVLLSDKLKRQHIETVVVVTECARVNRMLLESLFPKAGAVTTYGARGQRSARLDTGLVDVES